MFFDALGVTWEYEKEGFDLGEHGWYLPDFWLPNMGIWAEIKPPVASLKERQKAYKLSSLIRGGVLLLEGTPGITQVEPGCALRQYSFDCTVFAGECHDIYDLPCCFITGFYHWNAQQFESLRRLLCEEQPDYIGTEEWQSRAFFVNDEVERRRILIEMDKLFFLRKHKMHHWRWKLGRCADVHFRLDRHLRTDRVWLAECDCTFLTDDSKEADKAILDAFVTARSARFEHGERG